MYIHQCNYQLPILLGFVSRFEERDTYNVNGFRETFVLNGQLQLLLWMETVRVPIYNSRFEERGSTIIFTGRMSWFNTFTRSQALVKET